MAEKQQRTHGILLTKDPMGPKIPPQPPPVQRFSRHKHPTGRWSAVDLKVFLTSCIFRAPGGSRPIWLETFRGNIFWGLMKKPMKNSRKPGMLFVSLSVWVVFDYNSWYIDWYLFKCDDNWIFLVYFWKILSFLRIHHKIFRSFLKAAMVSVYLWACYQFQPIHKILRRSFGQMFYQTHPTRGWRQVIETKSVLSLSIQKICSNDDTYAYNHTVPYVYIYTCIYNMSEQRSP